MKKIFLLLALFATVFLACSDDDEKDNNLPEEPTETIDYWYITMNVDIRSNDQDISITCAQADSIRWGNAGNEFIKANFRNTSQTTLRAPLYDLGNYTITIKGHEPITKFGCMSIPNYGDETPDAVITSFDISAPDSIKEIEVYNTKITTVDLKKYPALSSVSIRLNHKIETIDVSNCQKLEELWCFDNQQLITLNASNCTELKELLCYNNQLTSLNVSSCAGLKELSCYHNRLTSLDLSGCSKLESLECAHNQLTSLDISKCTELKELLCHKNLFNNDAMNVIYNSLPDRTGKEAGRISFSQGDAKGDITIAKNKNWKIETGFN